jgi:hypothetical protein
MVENSEKKFSLNGFVVMKIDKAPAQSRSLLKALAHSSERVEITLEMYSKSDVSSLSDVERMIDFLVVVLISMQEIPFSSSIVLMAFVPNFFDIALNFSSFDLTKDPSPYPLPQSGEGKKEKDLTAPLTFVLSRRGREEKLREIYLIKSILFVFVNFGVFNV